MASSGIERPWMFPQPVVFIASALGVLAAVLFAMRDWTPPPPPRQPTIARLLSQNEALVVAAKKASGLGYDLSDMECQITDPNRGWYAYLKSCNYDFPGVDPMLRDPSRSDEYWAVYMSPADDPMFGTNGGDLWVFVRRSDLAVLDSIQGK